MNKKRLLFVLIATITVSITARWWLPALLQMLSVNGDLIQSLDSLISIVSSAITVISAIWGYLLIREDRKETETTEQRNRLIMLNHVENFWVKGILEKSLHGAALLELGIKEDPDAVTYPWAIKREATKETLPSGMSMLNIFQDIGLGRSLLILGAPGSGKTTMLLELTRQLIERAREDVTEPIPVVFNLSSWTEKITLAEWLARELNTIYYVPIKVAPTWVKENRMLLLLDGLDEVKQECRAKCVDAINDFRKVNGLTNLVISSRSQDYADLKTRLSFDGAIEIQPLTPRQIKAYFKQFGREMDSIKNLQKKDAVLGEMAQTPLFLSIMTLAYYNISPGYIWVSEDVDQQREHLFNTYVARMFQRLERSRSKRFQNPDVLHWLPWLASKMMKFDKSPFLIHHLQPSWLEQKQQLILYRLIAGLVGGLTLGSTFALILGMIYWLVGYSMFLEYKISFAQSGTLFAGLSGGVFMGLIAGLAVGMTDNISPDPSIGIKTIINVVCGCVLGAVIWLDNGLIGGLIGGLNISIFFMLTMGLATALMQGYIQHFVLLFVMFINNLIPWKLRTFLDHSVDLIFLRRVGGGYIFVHRLLMEHFADMYQEEPE